MIKLLSFLLFFLIFAGFAQSELFEKKLTLYRVNETAVEIDGNIVSKEWTNAVKITDFIQREPDENQPAFACSGIVLSSVLN